MLESSQSSKPPSTRFSISSIASLPLEQRTEVLQQLTEVQALALWRDWEFLARDEQLAPDRAANGIDDWIIWLVLAGRGFGKTRTGAEWVRARVKSGKAKRIALIAPTAFDARTVMVEGDSGIMSVCWAGDLMDDGSPLGYPEWSPGNKQITWPNGTIATTFSAEEPERLRGPQHDTIWADELAAWARLQDAWDMAMFGFRLGDPRAIVTTTPKPLPLIRQLVADPTNAVTRGSTYDNRPNLADSFFKKVVARYEGTRLGRQELRGEVLEDVEGALWTREMIRYEDEVRGIPRFEVGHGRRRIMWSNGGATNLVRVGVAIDPQAKKNEASALTGIVVGGVDSDGNGYLLADRSGSKTPGEWATTAVTCYDEFEADFIVAEVNQGGDMVVHTIDSARPNLPVQMVHASHSKQARAEPVSALYEKRRILHVGPMPELEDQLLSWEPMTGAPSPDRLDATVWLFTALMLGQGELIFRGLSKSDFMVSRLNGRAAAVRLSNGANGHANGNGHQPA